MFARHVTVQLKADSATKFNSLIEKEILPLLRKQKGFRDEITLVAPERSLALAISLWDTKGDADAYHRATYSDVLKTLTKLIEGTPKVETFEVANSTFTKGAAKTA